jgi:hypothetical protein
MYDYCIRLMSVGYLLVCSASLDDLGVGILVQVSNGLLSTR